jgi:hypothetical protein
VSDPDDGRRRPSSLAEEVREVAEERDDRVERAAVMADMEAAAPDWPE